ncbi:nucleotide sugar dehydrogenase [Methylorubrum populi]|uniref:nucleotide sugar dehydrogenase n=1 Tax=Methylorubrum populi TaxID=223967 RepID=UPI00115026CE|nr:nucleotide sugar dehydrogenase [Methylorubrum populi]QDI82178.1 nucleotide sugar dehydrogenase [Methylorubrum populi]
MAANTASIVKKFESRTSVIGIIGLGYVGLPLACAALKVGFHVVGFDIDAGKVQSLRSGRSYIDSIDDGIITKYVSSGFLRATENFERLRDVDAIIICVPTPLTKQREPDLSFIESTAVEIAKNLQEGQLVVLESTTWPGTTVEVVKPILEKSGLICGVDFFLAFSPEREDPGNIEFSTSKIPKIVGGDGETALLVANAMYSSFVSETVPVSSTQAAEAVKLTENIFRAVNIALVNELKIVFDAMNIDVWEVIEAAKTKPFGFMPFYPGPGLGGHCIPIDPFYLTWKAREYELSTRFIELAGEINVSMPNYVIDKLSKALDERERRGLNAASILVLGVSYKKNISDIRESPSLKIIETLEKRGSKVDYYDPHVPEITITREHPSLAGKRSIDWNPSSLSNYDAALIVIDHDAYDYGAIVENSSIIIDTRNSCARNGKISDKIIKA